jgi:TolB-like protein/DNA-binding winged helix-turn-helix (wHTH) protein/tetratricopeptide (TPR) repeat protein
MPMMANFAATTGAPRIDLAETPDFDLGGMHVSPARREVRFHGVCRELEPRVAQVLVALASARPGVLSRDRLAEQCWEGRIVGEDALYRCILALRNLAREFTPEPFTIETVPRVGYCLIEHAADASAAPDGGAKPRTNTMRAAVIAAAFLVVLAAGTLAYGLWRPVGGDASPASIAVLTFRNLSGGDPYFAEGIGEEILGQLAREPQFRVAGRTAATPAGKAADLREVAQRLRADYVLDGSVRTQGGRVRVNAALVRANDGIRLWSDSFDGNLDDIFAIQKQIGVAVAGALRRKLVRTPVLSRALVTTGEAYNLHLTARGLLRTYNRRVGATAAGLLRDAINLDPGYAPAWASLAAAVNMNGALTGYEGFIAARPEAQRNARHALLLAPDLAQAHSTLGMLLGYGDPEGQAHFRRAAELDPNSAENVLWLGVAHEAAGEFADALSAYRRAAELDPLWFRTVAHVAIATAEMGNRAEAEAIVKRGFPEDEIQQELQLGRVAWIFGDFSDAARRWSIVARSESPRWSDTARRSMNDATTMVGLQTGPLIIVPNPHDQRRLAPVWIRAAPQPALWQTRNRDRIAADVYRQENHVAAKLMLNAGRIGELTAAYDGPVGLLGLRGGLPLRVDQVSEAPVVALALRRDGRAAEADRLLGEAAAAIAAVYRRGGVPFWFDADAAAVWAAQGRGDEALVALERAVRRGWTHTGSTDLVDIADEPAFSALRSAARFARLRGTLGAHRAREQEETARLRL